MFVSLAALLFLGAGCSRGQSTGPAAGEPQDRQTTPTSFAKPTAQPQIPDAAKNVPRPEVK